MSSFGRSRPFVQPQTRPAIDWTHPLAQGLIYSSCNSGADAGFAPMNYVAGGATGVIAGTSAIASSHSYHAAVSTKFNGSSDAASHAIDLSPYRQITLSWWMYWDAFANNDKVAFEYTPTWNSNSGLLVIPNESSGGLYSVGVSNGGSGSICLRGITRPSGAIWLHHAMLVDRNQAGAAAIPTFYLNSAPQTLTTQASTFTASNFANSSLFFMSRNRASLFGAGRILNVNIHNRLLGQREVAQLVDAPMQMFRVPSVRSLFTAPTAATVAADTTRFFLAA